MPFKKMYLLEAIISLLESYSQDGLLSSAEKHEVCNSAFNLAWLDLESYAKKDPANNGSIQYVFDACKCFKAVMTYRLAHEVDKLSSKRAFKKGEKLSAIARLMTEDARVITAVEIHPKAKIGKNFVIDHGSGTVIGETCEIGDDCYILQSVLLGAYGISKNAQKKRHPTIGNNVEIGSFSKLLGDIKIGNNVSIGTGCLITSDIPDNCRVSLVNEYQIQKRVDSCKSSLKIYGFNILDDVTIIVFGEGFSGKKLSVNILDELHRVYKNVLEIHDISDKTITIKFINFSFLEPRIQRKELEKFKFEFITQDDNFSIIIGCFALNQMIERFKKEEKP